MDHLVGEASGVSNSKHARSSNSSSPLVPPLSIHMSPVHTEESNEVAQINSPCGSVFPLSMPVSHLSGLMDSDLLSPQSRLLSGSNGKVSGVSSPRKRKASTDSVDSVADNREKEGLVLDNDCTDTSDNGFSSMHESSEDSLQERESDQRVKDEMGKQNVESAGDNEKALSVTSPAVLGSSPKNNGDEETCLSETRSEGTPQGGKKTDRPAPCSALAGFMSMATRSGQTVLCGAVPSTVPRPGTALNSCFPVNDGSWYQIISASIPSVFSCQPSTEASHTTSSTTTTTVTTSSSTSCPSSAGSVSTVGFGSLGFLSSLPLMATATASTTTTTHSSLATPVPTPCTTVDPLLAILQQYTAGSACTPDLPTPLSALHLPLGLTSAAVTSSSTSSPTPRYLYATNPRTGQLLILSTVGDMAGGHSLQPLQLQQQSTLQQMLQLQQQQLQMMPDVKAEWKSPLGQSQQQNCQTTVSSGVKSGGRPGSVISQRPTCVSHSSQGGNHDENMPSVVVARELLALASPARNQTLGQSGVPLPLFHSSPSTSNSKNSDEPIRENHNMKERRRRARIKDACDLMRQLVPGMSEKTDKATVFEFSARYIHFLKNFVGTHHDKDFLIKYSPY